MFTAKCYMCQKKNLLAKDCRVKLRRGAYIVMYNGDDGWQKYAEAKRNEVFKLDSVASHHRVDNKKVFKILSKSARLVVIGVAKDDQFMFA